MIFYLAGRMIYSKRRRMGNDNTSIRLNVIIKNWMLEDEVVGGIYLREKILLGPRHCGG